MHTTFWGRDSCSLLTGSQAAARREVSSISNGNSADTAAFCLPWTSEGGCEPKAERTQPSYTGELFLRCTKSAKTHHFGAHTQTKQQR